MNILNPARANATLLHLERDWLAISRQAAQADEASVKASKSGDKSEHEKLMLEAHSLEEKAGELEIAILRGPAFTISEVRAKFRMMVRQMVRLPKGWQGGMEPLLRTSDAAEWGKSAPDLVVALAALNRFTERLQTLGFDALLNGELERE